MQITQSCAYKLSLLGTFRFETEAGKKIAVSSKRARAMLAMLACAPRAERSRTWLEAMLWCNRSEEQAKASLRKELSNLRKLINSDDKDVIGADTNTVWLDREAIAIDVIDGPVPSGEQFLEGLDIAGEQAFEDWLRERRAEFSQKVQAAASATEPKAAQIVPPPLAEARPLRLAIAVLPFHIESTSQAKQYIAFGIGEELISRLSRLRWLPVITASSSSFLGEKSHDVRDVAASLGARYIVEGSFRPRDDSYRFLITLADGENGRSLWNDSIDLRALDDLTSVETALDGIIAALDKRVDRQQQILAVSSKTESDDAIQLVWKARWYLAKLSEEGIDIASQFLDQAATIDPDRSEVLIERAWLETCKLWLKRGTHDDIRNLRRIAQRANLADPDDARGYMLAGIAEFWLQNPGRAETLLRRAIDLNPSLVMAHAQLGGLLLHNGLYDMAIISLKIARNLSPNDQHLFYTEGELAMAFLAKGEFAKAIQHADASLARRTGYWSSHVAKINALIGLGDLPAARRAYEELMASQPGFRTHHIDWLPYQDISRNAALREGLNQVRVAND